MKQKNYYVNPNSCEKPLQLYYKGENDNDLQQIERERERGVGRGGVELLAPPKYKNTHKKRT
jgi:hypothetical protein